MEGIRGDFNTLLLVDLGKWEQVLLKVLFTDLYILYNGKGYSVIPIIVGIIDSIYMKRYSLIPRMGLWDQDYATL